MFVKVKAEYNGQMRIRLCQDKKIKDKKIFLLIVEKKHYGNYWAKIDGSSYRRKKIYTTSQKYIYLFFTYFIYLFMFGKMLLIFLILTIYIYKNTIKQQYCKILLQFERTAFKIF